MSISTQTSKGGNGMRKLLSIGGAIAALVIVGAATANELGGNAVKSVNATFSAATSSVAWTRSCTGADGTYAATRAVYTGTSSSSEPTLNGPLTLDTQSLINQTTGVGTVRGNFTIASQTSRISGTLSSVTSSGATAGLLEARATHDGPGLVANFSSSYDTTAGFTNGKIGASAGGQAVELVPATCNVSQQTGPDTIRVNGAVTAVSATSITAAGVTCVVPASLASTAGAVHVGDRIALECTVTNGTTTLDEDALLADADRAMYENKAARRDG